MRQTAAGNLGILGLKESFVQLNEVMIRKCLFLPSGNLRMKYFDSHHQKVSDFLVLP